MAGAELDLADEDQVVPARLRALGNPVQRRAFDDCRARFLPARGLAAEAVELAVAGKDAQRPARQRRGDGEQQHMGVRSEHQGARIGQPEFGRDMRLGRGPDLAHHPLPFAVGKAHAVLPGGELADIGGIGPQMMRMRGEVQPLGRRRQRALEQVLVARHSWVRSVQSSGKARLASVDSR